MTTHEDYLSHIRSGGPSKLCFCGLMGQHGTLPLMLPGSSRLFSSTYIHTGKILYIFELLSQGNSGTTLKTTQVFSRLEFSVQHSRYLTAASVDSSELVFRYMAEKAVCWIRQISFPFPLKY